MREVSRKDTPPAEDATETDELEAIVEKVDAETHDVSVTADDRGELAARLDLQAAPKLRLARIAPHGTLSAAAIRAKDRDPHPCRLRGRHRPRCGRRPGQRGRSRDKHAPADTMSRNRVVNAAEASR